jgi:catalase
MNGYGSHTFKNVNENQEAVYVKYHFKTDQGIANLSSAEAGKLASEDPDYATRDLYNAIADGDFPSWTLYIQVMTFEQAMTVPFNPFDLTKIWPHKVFPLHEVGRMVLDRNPDNYFAEVEQLAFAPSHLIPGVEPSPDKMLQARLFSYPDTHRHRLGVNYQSIPVNMPLNTKVNNYQRDGSMMVHANGGGAPNYFPNSFIGPTPSANGIWHSDSVSGDVLRCETGDEDNFSQCGEFFRNVLDADARERLTDNIAGHISCAQEFIRERAIANFASADANYGRMIRHKVKDIAAGQKKTGQRFAASPLSPPRTVPAPGTCPYGFFSKL